MRTTALEKLKELQKKPSHVRNLCILAHVDHGKTTLADALVASNGIISQRMAGKLRYLDSREDEQIRGITMKSSAISLQYQSGGDEFLINLIDSPGHVDFSSEVSTAVRLCDGAVVVVDVVEGVCPQTHAVLRQAWLENIKPILVLNKLDRLILELKMEPTEAFMHLQQILTEVNLVTSELFTADVMSMQTTDSSTSAAGDQKQTYDWTEDADELEYKNIYFSPELGNVVFAAAYDGWGFSIDKFAEIYGKKLGMNEVGLRKTLWGDFFLNSKTKRIMKGAQSKGKKPLFVQFVLESIWAVYDAVVVSRDKEMTEKIVKSLNLKITARDSRHNDPRVQLQALMGQWLPVSQAVLDKVVEKLPSPLEIEEEKVEKLMCNQARRFDSMPQETQDLKQDFLSCKASEDAPVIVFVSKMFPVDKASLPKNKQRPLTEEELQQRREAARLRHAERMAGKNIEASSEHISTPDSSEGVAELVPEDREQEDDTDQVFVAFARVFSGCVRKGQKLYVLGPKHDPAKALQKLSDGCSGMSAAQRLEDLARDDHVTVVTVTDLYLFMGRELEALDCVPAGNVLGIGGLEDHILKSGTLSSTVACPSFTDLYFDASPILRVALEPIQAGDMPKLVKGLKLLNQADPCVQVLVQETGEHVIITAGEVHLRRCIDDLTERYAKIEISESSPIVPFRETIVPPPTIDMVNESIQDQNPAGKNEKQREFDEDEEVLETGLVRIFTPSKFCMVQIRAVPLPQDVTDFLDENQFLIKTLDQYFSAKISERNKSEVHFGTKLKQSTKEAIREFKEKLEALFLEAGKQWKGCVDCIWAFGPKRVGPNLLLNKVDGYNRTSVWDCLRNDKTEMKVVVRDYDYSVVSGFQLATLTGPLCDEPMRGVCFIMEKWEIGSHVTELGNDVIESKNDSISLAKNSAANYEENVHIQLSKLNLKNGECTDNLQSDIPSSGIDEQIPECSKTSVEGSSLEVESAGESRFDIEKEAKRTDMKGHVSGQLISIVKEACQKAFQTQPQRLMAAMYKCNIQATADVLGKLFAVLGKRNGRTLQDEMREGSQIFNIIAVIPVVESFGFCEDIRKKTSGLASPQLVFSHWETIDVDPYWVPTTEEEIMHYGEKADCENRARAYMNTVRERKGLKVDKKIVEHAEKQRTLTRNK
ncbi:elongation factor-like GTPase 1 isoform X2 [Mercenaria mercenaria]|nr:elongation factor-like GTPase 1 isoform X2 [Mercenaria mercenaria]XP_053405957.1 elongation factor-like GTPase 1 isoform X2 [Mercenaria mercenaria]